MQRESGSILMRLAPQGIKKQHLTLSMEILPRNSYLGSLESAEHHNFQGKRAISGGRLENHNFQLDVDSPQHALE